MKGIKPTTPFFAPPPTWNPLNKSSQIFEPQILNAQENVPLENLLAPQKYYLKISSHGSMLFRDVLVVKMHSLSLKIFQNFQRTGIKFFSRLVHSLVGNFEEINGVNVIT